MGSPYTKERILASLERQASAPADDMRWLGATAPEMAAVIRAALPARRIPAAVLVPLVERAQGLNVLLTERSATLKDHAGQISFPGGRIEPGDTDAWHAALRETWEEIGLAPRCIEYAGYLPDHLLPTGFRVTPVVGFVSADYELHLDAAEVTDAFEVPLDFLFDPANHKPRMRRVGTASFETFDIPYGERNIWGATAGMLLTLRRLLQDRAPATS
jgi:8-oxo-dGTP pyrophosphatase MutT (NUDIX family)